MQTQNLIKEIKKLEKFIEQLEESLREVKHSVDVLREETTTDEYKNLPGIEGIFDGQYLTCDDGSKFEVPVNYAAKSRIIYGDRLKKIDVEEKDENGALLEQKAIYKHVTKVPRKKIEGVMSRKDGKWYLLTEGNSYKVLDRAAEFNNAEQHDVAVGIIPEDNPNVPFAALDAIKKKSLELEKDVSRQVAHNESTKDNPERLPAHARREHGVERPIRAARPEPRTESRIGTEASRETTREVRETRAPRPAGSRSGSTRPRRSFSDRSDRPDRPSSGGTFTRSDTRSAPSAPMAPRKEYISHLGTDGDASLPKAKPTAQDDDLM